MDTQGYPNYYCGYKNTKYIDGGLVMIACKYFPSNREKDSNDGDQDRKAKQKY